LPSSSCGTAAGPDARKDTGLRNLPLKGFAQNQLRCEIVALACELLAWAQMLALTGTARRWEPKRLRLRLLAVAGRLARGGRRPLRLRLAERWPWAGEITAAPTRRDSRAARRDPARKITHQPIPQASTPALRNIEASAHPRLPRG
jgi:DDE family transposase